MRFSRAKHARHSDGLRRQSLSLKRRGRYILPWLFSFDARPGVQSRARTSSYRGTATFQIMSESEGVWLPRLPHVDAPSVRHRRMMPAQRHGGACGGEADDNSPHSGDRPCEAELSGLRNGSRRCVCGCPRFGKKIFDGRPRIRNSIGRVSGLLVWPG